MPYQPIENYGLIGDLKTVALVGMNGSIDFFCFPRFDSPSIFAALLDDEKGGRFQIHPLLEGTIQKQLYVSDSNILLTRFLCSEGICEVSDFMTICHTSEEQHLVRRIKTIRGTIQYRVICQPRFDYGRIRLTIDIREQEALFLPEKEGVPSLRLRTRIPLEKTDEGDAIAVFTLNPGESVAFVLESAEAPKKGSSCLPDFVAESFKETLNFWHQWVGQSNYKGRWQEMVNRSALTLKLLTSKEFGSIVAAPTFGLPEEIGGERNWDYRYTWIRDASFTLYGLMRLGYMEEATAFMQWIEDRCADLNPDGSLQIMYGIDGQKILTEENLSHFEGYRGSQPVRIGNAAYKQSQLDIYGELLDSIYLYNKYGQPISIDLWQNLIHLLNWVMENWKNQDYGIWEIRGKPQSFLYSRLMCWVALDRGIRLAKKRSFPAPLIPWTKARDEIYQRLISDFWNEGLASFVQTAGGETFDAATLMMPLVKFISPTDPRWLSTLKQIKDHLVDDSLVYRYRSHQENLDGLIGSEGTFTMCSFWFVENLARSGDVQQARFLFEKLLGYANHLGLFAEEIGLDGRQLGNFPQAFTHLALISAAVNIDSQLTKKHIHW